MESLFCFMGREQDKLRSSLLGDIWDAGPGF